MGRQKEFEPDFVLQRAMTLFWERGYDSTSMQDLVARMGIHKRSMYDTFGDKRSLFVQALDLYITRSEESQSAFLEGNRESARETIRLLMHRSFEPGDHPRGCFAVNTATELIGRESDVAARLDRHFGVILSTLTDLISQGQRAGEISNRISSESLAISLQNAWLGLRVQVRLGKSDLKDLQHMADSIVTALI
jgi:TetR/AcrR family transcriptional repressor of nem operon